MFHSPELIGGGSAIRSIRELALLDTMPQADFTALVGLAARAAAVPVAMLILVDQDRLWIRAAHGATTDGGNCDIPICEAAMRHDGLFEIADAALDPRSAAADHVVGPPHVRFFAGMALRVASCTGAPPVPVGLLCLIDTRPRTLDPAERNALEQCARLAETLLASRVATIEAQALAETANQRTIELKRQQRTFGQAERMAMIGSWRLVIETGQVEWSEGVYRIHELGADDELTLENALDFYPPGSREQVQAAIARTIETGAPFNVEIDFETARGRRLRVRAIGEVELQDGRPVAVTGLFQDVTEHHRMEMSLRRSASIDELTRIANRAAFNRELRAAMTRAADAEAPLTLVLIDLDGFKATNDNHGHIAGDDILRSVGRRLRAPYLGGAFAARLGGDEFALIIEDAAVSADIDPAIDQLLADLKLPVQTGAGPLPVSGTIGFADYSRIIATPREFLHRADTALYEAKRIERGTARKYAGLLYRPAGHTRPA